VARAQILFAPGSFTGGKEEVMRLTTFAIFAALIGCSGPVVTRARDVAPARWGSYSVELVDEGGRVLPTFTHGGRTYVLGALGHRYFVRVRNGSGARIEVVASVDGRDVLDGAPAEWSKRGYLVDAYGTLTIDGYRLSQDAVAAFRFSSVPRSYAALEGDPRDVGVIGVAVFRERAAPRVQRPVERELRSEAAPAPLRSAPADAGRSSSAPAPGQAEASKRPGLGTEFGEEHESHVRQVSFQRASTRPDVILTLRYDDRAGLRAAGVDVDGGCPEVELRSSADPFRRDTGYAKPPRGWSRAP
jgi:hypothetical protein